MNVTNSPVAFQRPLNKNIYFAYGRLDLPHSVRSYVDGGCSEYQDLSDESRLLDLSFVLLKGYNLKKEIKDWLKEHPYVSEDYIVSCIGYILLKFNDVDEEEIFNNMDVMDLSQMIDYFKPLLLNCYREENGMQMFDESDIANTSRSIQGTLGGHYLGEIHPNGKWQWTEYKPNKYDWRAIK